MPKKTLVVVAHPDLAKSTVNAAWVAALAARPDRITVRSLYDLYPDGRIDVAAEQAAVRAHDRVIFQFPLHWFATPALLKQWFDEVLAYGFVYGPGGDALAGKEIGVAVSTGGKGEAYRAGGQNAHTLDELLRPIQQTAAFCRAVWLPLHAFTGAMWGVDAAALAADAAAFADRVADFGETAVAA
jgi:putative NADPH-quinone reductase